MGRQDKIKIIFISILIVNALGYILRVNNLDTYLILAGFRFHLSFVIPFLFVFRLSNLPKLKQILMSPSYNKTFPPLIWIFLPVIIILGGLFLLKKIDVGDPEYFYEFGLSSIFDLPLYLMWNLPQLLMLTSFLILTNFERNKIFSVFLCVFFLFAFEFIPLGKEKFNYMAIAILFFSALSAGLIIANSQNVYWFSIFFFMMFWLNILSFGTDSQTMIHILFASQYKNWEGFFNVAKGFRNYLLAVQSFIAVLILLLSNKKVKEIIS